jgi:hypothetical protein
MPGGFSYIGAFKVEESSGEVQSQAVGSRALLATCADQTTIEVNSEDGKLRMKTQGTSLAAGVQRASMSKYAGTWLQGSLTASAGAAGVLSVKNGYGGALIVDRVILYITTVASEGGVTLDVGVAGTAISADTLIDGLDINAATGVFDNVADGGTNGKSRQLLATDSYITATASADPAGLIGFYAIHVIDISA